MTDYNRVDSGNVDIVKSDGTVLVANKNGLSSTFGVTLANSTTYYLALGSARAPMPAETSLVAVHMKWAAAVAATITVETCNFPRHANSAIGLGPDDVLDYSGTAGDWIQENPTTGYIGVVGASNSATNLTLTAGGAAAGGATIHLGNLGTRRCRIKIVVTTGGLMRLSVHGKAGT